MSQFRLIVGMLVLLLATESGCAARRFFVPCCGDGCKQCGNCDRGCGACNGCGPSYDPILGDCSKCGVCGGNCRGFTPVGYLKYSMTCGSGCGSEIYWGEWLNDPPDCCDPCDNCGRYVGPQGCCKYSKPATAGDLWGRRYPGACCGGSCGGGCGPANYAADGRGIASNSQQALAPDEDGGPNSFTPAQPQRMSREPTPAQLPRRAAPQPKAERPAGTSRVSYARRPMNPRPRSNAEYDDASR